MHSTPEKGRKSSDSPKRVRFEDPERPRASRSSSFANRRPASPYPEPMKLPATSSEQPDYYDTPSTSKEQQVPSLQHILKTPAIAHSSTGPETTGGATSFGSQQVFTHYPGGPGGFLAQPLAHYQSQHRQFYTVNAKASMTTCDNAMPAPTGVHFQPQVPNTTNGPQIHYYVPRHDGAPLNSPLQTAQQVPIPVPVQAQPVAIPLQQVVTPDQPVRQSAVLQPVMQQPGIQLVMMQQPAPDVPQQQSFYSQAQPQVMMPSNPFPGPVAGPLMPDMSMQAGVYPEPALGVGLTDAEAQMMNNQTAYESNMDRAAGF